MNRINPPEWLIDGTKKRRPRDVDMKKAIKMNPNFISTGDEPRLRLPKESRDALGLVVTAFLGVLTTTTLIIAILL